MTRLSGVHPQHGWLSQADERERRRIAHVLHEQVQQQLAAAQMHLQLAQGQCHASADALVHLASGIESLRAAMADTAWAVDALRPRSLDVIGLTAAMEELAQAYRHRGGLQIELERVGDPALVAGLAPAVADCAYRVARECLDNVITHAQAGFVHLLLDTTSPDAFLLQIHDDGIGIQPGDLDKPGALGLKAMTERLDLFGGSLRLESRAVAGGRGGTKVSARWPTQDHPYTSAP